MKRILARARTPKTGYFRLFIAYIMTILIIVNTSISFADTISDLVPLIIQAESSGNPNAYNKEGSYGLMGITRKIFEEYRNFQLKNTDVPCFDWEYSKFHEQYNICCGSWYLRKIQSWLPKEYKESKAHIVASYNMGFSKFKSMGFKVPKKHRNKIYNEVYKEYWRNK